VSAEHFDLRTIAPQPWKNGAGLTREIALAESEIGGFDWRLSVAEVERDAPFSAFPGIDRSITLLRGAGLHLRSADGRIDHRLTQPLVPFRFAGDAVLNASLIDGACSDFNVMTRRGAFRSEVTCHRAAAELPGAEVTLVFCCEGHWLVKADVAQPLSPLQALLWRAPLTSLALRPARAGEPGAVLLVRLCHDRSA
jgi:hypothetical protein